MKLINTFKKNKRYLLFFLATAMMLIFTIMVISSKMIPVKYLILLGIVEILMLAGCFFLQRKKGKLKWALAIILEIIAIVIASCGCYFLYHTMNMVQNITNVETDSETICAYIMADKEYTSLLDALDGTFGKVLDQSEQAVDQMLNGVAEKAETKLSINEYQDMFLAADALQNQEIQVLVMNEAYAGILSEVEGYEWFYTDVKVLEVSVEEIEVVVDNTTDDKEADNEETDEEAQDDKKEDKEEIKMELMAPPEQVDWGSLVGQGVATAPEGTFVAYISGADTWGAASTKSRSDVNILAVVNTNTKQILLVSTPRDFYVPMAASNGVKDKLTHAGIYGIDNSMATLEMLYGVDISYYVKVNFTGFVGIIDALGGIDVYSDSAFRVDENFAYVEGINHLYGVEALAFARERYNVAGGDVARGIHQMEVIKGVINKCVSPDIIYNYANIMNQVSGCFITDMSDDKIASLIRMQLGDMASWSVSSISVIGSGDYKTTYSLPNKNLYVMIPDENSVADAKSQIAAVLGQ